MKPFYFLIAVASAMLLQAVSGYAHPPPGDIIQEEEVVATHNAPTVGSDSLVVQLDLEYWFLAPVIKVPVTPVEGVVEFTYELRSASVDSIYNLVGYVGPPGRMYHHTKWDVVLALGSRNLSFFQQKLRQVRAILASNAGDQCCFSHNCVLLGFSNQSTKSKLSAIREEDRKIGR